LGSGGDVQPTTALDVAHPKPEASFRFIASSATSAETGRGRCLLKVHRTVTAPRDERDRQARATRAAALLAMRDAPVGDMTVPAVGSDAPSGSSVVAGHCTVPQSTLAAESGELFDSSIARDEPRLRALAEGLEGGGKGNDGVDDVSVLRMPVPLAALHELADLVLALVETFPLDGSGRHHVTVLGLQFVAAAEEPVLMAVLRGPVQLVLAAHAEFASRCHVSLLTSASDTESLLKPFRQPPSSHPALVPTSTVDSGLAKALATAPKVARSVLIVKEHALGCAAVIVSKIAAAGLQVVGLRLVHLDAQLGSAAQLGLDSPITPSTVLAVQLEGYDVCERVLSLCGAADSKLARTVDAGSFRARFGIDRVHNVVSTPRHEKGAKRCAAFFFGGRLADGEATTVALSCRLAREPLLLLCTATAERQRDAAAKLLGALQRAGFALHGAKRASEAMLHVVGVGQQSDQSWVAFLLSREGVPAAVAAQVIGAQLDAGEALQAEIHGCSTTLAQELLGGTASSMADVFRYVLFALKSDIL